MRKLIVCVIFVLTILIPASSVQATYTQQFALGADSTFQGQVSVAMLQTAATVLNETAGTNGHATRALFARQVMQNPTFWNPIISSEVAAQTANPMTPLTVPSTVADTLVQTAMDAQWSNLSGYFKQ